MAQQSKNETVQLQSEISNEIERDAPHIARMVFGNAKDHPDVVGVSNERLDQVYRDAYQRNDRAWLHAEARRDPLQFEKVTDRIGVIVPPPAPMAPEPSPTAGAFARAVAQPPQAAPAAVPSPLPVAPEAPVPPVLASPSPVPQAPPVILGPNGQPLPPSGVVGTV